MSRAPARTGLLDLDKKLSLGDPLPGHLDLLSRMNIWFLRLFLTPRLGTMPACDEIQMCKQPRVLPSVRLPKGTV